MTCYKIKNQRLCRMSSQCQPRSPISVLSFGSMLKKKKLYAFKAFSFSHYVAKTNGMTTEQWIWTWKGED